MPKRLITSILIFLLSIIIPLTTDAFTREEAEKIFKELIPQEFKIVALKEAPLEGFWEVATEIKGERTIFYLHKNLRYIIHGQLLDRQSKKNLTLDRLKAIRNVDPSKLPIENAISMGSGKRKLYVFTNPDCHFCFQLHEDIKGTKDLQSFLFLYPLSQASYEKVKSIWCSNDRLKSLEEAYQGKEIKSSPCDTRAIDKNIELGRHLLIDSTPTLILQSGRVIEGYAQPHTLETILQKP